MVLQNYQKLIEITSNMIYIVALGVGLKCPRKIHLNTQCPPSPQKKIMKKWLAVMDSIQFCFLGPLAAPIGVEGNAFVATKNASQSWPGCRTF